MMKNILIIDTETCGTLRAPLVYDIGFIVADLHGNVKFDLSTVVSEIFLNRKKEMNLAYFSDKIPMYNRDVKSGKRACMSLKTTKNIFMNIVKLYNIHEIYAYNIAFDIRALNNTYKVLFGENFFPDDVTFSDIWSISANSILNSRNYFNFCIRNNLMTEKGNISTTAETVYKYISKNVDFIEDHTALEDCYTEYEILLATKKTKKKMIVDTKQPWRVVNKTAKERGFLV